MVIWGHFPTQLFSPNSQHKEAERVISLYLPCRKGVVTQFGMKISMKISRKIRENG